MQTLDRFTRTHRSFHGSSLFAACVMRRTIVKPRSAWQGIPVVLIERETYGSICIQGGAMIAARPSHISKSERDLPAQANRSDAWARSEYAGQGAASCPDTSAIRMMLRHVGMTRSTYHQLDGPSGVSAGSVPSGADTALDPTPIAACDECGPTAFTACEDSVLVDKLGWTELGALAAAAAFTCCARPLHLPAFAGESGSYPHSARPGPRSGPNQGKTCPAPEAGPGPAKGWGRGTETEAEAGLTKTEGRERLRASS